MWTSMLAGVAVVWSYRPFSLVRAMIWRYRWTNALFVLLIAVSVGLGVGLIAQERGIRKGTARAAEKFDLVVTAPGSEVQMMLATVYLQPVDVPLIDGSNNSLVGFHIVNEDRLQALDGDALADLHGAGHLMPLFMAVASVAQFSELVARKNRRIAHG